MRGSSGACGSSPKKKRLLAGRRFECGNGLLSVVRRRCQQVVKGYVERIGDFQSIGRFSDEAG